MVLLRLYAVYQIIDDYLADAVDAIENEFRASCKEKGIALDGTKSEALKEVGLGPSLSPNM